ncbi:Bromodomain protein [Cryptosporidium meleagridis]|uniref:Bromodomain protein n=1 Tax=Cryptosporidium meleagridis TaxID=93969 RepID=A0A2P4Z215_9CRYT|nr:Bromodomain protein [Cryptosporidium meleagridis]
MNEISENKTTNGNPVPNSDEERSLGIDQESYSEISVPQKPEIEGKEETGYGQGPDKERDQEQEQEQEQQEQEQDQDQEGAASERSEGKTYSQKTDGDASSVVTQTSQNAVPEIRIPRGRGRPPRNANRADIGPSGLVSITSIWADDDKPKGKRGRPRLRPLEPEEKVEPEAAPNKPLKVKRPKGPKDIMHEIIHRLYKRDKQQIFAEPVNAEFVPDYYQVIKNPMDFSTMRKKVSQDEYKDFDSFVDDIKLIISNCYTYNKIGTMVYRMGLILEETWDKSLEGSRARYEQSIKNVEEYEEKKKAGEIISDSEPESQPIWNNTPTSPTMESPNPSNQRSMVTRRMEARLSGSHSPWVSKGSGGPGAIGGSGTGPGIPGERDLSTGSDFMSRRALGGHPFGGAMAYRGGELGRHPPYPGGIPGQGHQNTKPKGPTLADICKGGVTSIKENLEKLKIDRFEPFSSLIKQLATQPCIKTPTVDDWYVFDKQLSEIQYRNSVKRFIGDDSIQALKKIMDIETALLEIDPHPAISKLPLSDTRLLGIDTDDFAPFNQNLSVDGSFLLGVGDNHIKVALTLQDEVPCLDLTPLKELVTKYTQHPLSTQSNGGIASVAQGHFPNSSGVSVNGVSAGAGSGLGGGTGSGITQIGFPKSSLGGGTNQGGIHAPLSHLQTSETKHELPLSQRPAKTGTEIKGQDLKSMHYNGFGGHRGEVLSGTAETSGVSNVPLSQLGQAHAHGRIAYKHGYPPSLGSGPGSGTGSMPTSMPLSGTPGKPGVPGTSGVVNSNSYYEVCPPAKVQKFEQSNYPAHGGASHAFPPSHSVVPPHSVHTVHPTQPSALPKQGVQAIAPLSGGNKPGIPLNYNQVHGRGMQHGSQMNAQGHGPGTGIGHLNGHRIQSTNLVANPTNSNNVSPVSVGNSTNQNMRVSASSPTATTSTSNTHLNVNLNMASNAAAATTNASVSANSISTAQTAPINSTANIASTNTVNNTVNTPSLGNFVPSSVVPGSAVTTSSINGGSKMNHIGNVPTSAAEAPTNSSSISPTANVSNIQYLNSNDVRRISDKLNYSQNMMGSQVHHQGHLVNRSQVSNSGSHYLQMNAGSGNHIGAGSGGAAMVTSTNQRIDHTINGNIGQQKVITSGYIQNNEYMPRGADPNVGGGTNGSTSNNNNNSGNSGNMYGLYQHNAKKSEIPIDIREERTRLDQNMYMVEGLGMNGMNMRPRQQVLQMQSHQSSVKPPHYHHQYPPQSQIPVHKSQINNGNVSNANGSNNFYQKYNNNTTNSNSNIQYHNRNISPMGQTSSNIPNIANPINNLTSGGSQYPQDGINHLGQKK